jgi:hypothetical protein
MIAAISFLLFLALLVVVFLYYDRKDAREKKKFMSEQYLADFIRRDGKE